MARITHAQLEMHLGRLRSPQAALQGGSCCSSAPTRKARFTGRQSEAVASLTERLPRAPPRPPRAATWEVPGAAAAKESARRRRSHKPPSSPTRLYCLDTTREARSTCSVPGTWSHNRFANPWARHYRPMALGCQETCLQCLETHPWKSRDGVFPPPVVSEFS